MKERHPDGLEDVFCAAENFRANIVLDTGVAWSEDDFCELRVGSALVRSVGPTARCPVIRVNWDKPGLQAEYEPYSTLSTFRTLPGFGVIFGMYYQVELLSNNRLYSEVLPAKLGYPTFSETAKRNSLETREADGEKFVRIHKKDGLLVRVDRETEWKRKLRPQTVREEVLRHKK